MKYLVIEGNIGAGKTSLAQKIAEKHTAKKLLEKFDDNPFLEKFYKAPDKYAFLLELYFFIGRYEQHKEFIQKSNGLVVADYYFAKSLIFAEANLTEYEFDMYCRLFRMAYSTLSKPDLYVYLHADISKLLDNIKKRGRSYEKDIKAEYLKKIEQQYMKYLETITDFNVAVVHLNGADFLSSDVDFNRLERVIFETDFNTGMNHVYL